MVRTEAVSSVNAAAAPSLGASPSPPSILSALHNNNDAGVQNNNVYTHTRESRGRIIYPFSDGTAPGVFQHCVPCAHR